MESNKEVSEEVCLRRAFGLKANRDNKNVILIKDYFFGEYPDSVQRPMIYKAMEEYASQFKSETTSLREENERLREKEIRGDRMIVDLEHQKAVLREALRWYADSDNYMYDDSTLAAAWKNKNIERKAKSALQK
jgi:hypothetical protein